MKLHFTALIVLLSNSLSFFFSFPSYSSDFAKSQIYTSMNNSSIQKQSANALFQVFRKRIESEGYDYYKYPQYAAQDEKLLSQIIEISPNFREAYYYRALTYMSNDIRNEDKAIELTINDLNVYLRFPVTREDKNRYQAYLYRAELFVKQSKFGDAEADYASAINLINQYSSPEGNANIINSFGGDNAYMRRGEYFMERGNYLDAISDFTSAMQFGFGTSRYTRADAYKKIGNFKAAIDDISLEIRRVPDSSKPHLYNQRGLLYVKQRNWKAAISDFTEVVDRLGKALQEERKKKASSDELQLLQALREVYEARAKAYMTLKEESKAVKDLTTILELFDVNQISNIYEYNLGEVYLLRARVSKNVGDLESSTLDYKTAARIAEGFGDPGLAKQIRTEARSSGSVVSLSAPASVVTITRIFDFNGTNGSEPTDIIQSSSGRFYGVTSGGGTNGLGTLFSLDGQTTTTLVNFDGNNGRYPISLMEASNGSLYGLTRSGGSSDKGTVFRLNRDGTLTTLVNFNGINGQIPSGKLVEGSNGDIYGVTYAGGVGSRALGTLFKLSSSDNFTTVQTFLGGGGTHGIGPITLVKSQNNLILGLLEAGGQLGHGAVFELSGDNVIHVIGALSTQQLPGLPYIQEPYALTQVGNLFYGLSWRGISTELAPGPSKLFRILPTPNGSPSFSEVLAGFQVDTSIPKGFTGTPPMLISDGKDNIYGLIPSGGEQQRGALIRLTLPVQPTPTPEPTPDPPPGEDTPPDVSTSLARSRRTLTPLSISPPDISTIASFENASGNYPNALVLGRDGNLYGTAATGGQFEKGTIFKIILCEPPPSP